MCSKPDAVAAQVAAATAATVAAAAAVVQHTEVLSAVRTLSRGKHTVKTNYHESHE